MLNTCDKPELSMRYQLVDEGVPLIAGDIVLEIERRRLAVPEAYLGMETAVEMKRQVPAGESTGIDVPGQLWKSFHEMKPSVDGLASDGPEMGMSHMADPEAGTFLYFAGAHTAVFFEQFEGSGKMRPARDAVPDDAVLFFRTVPRALALLRLFL